MFSGLDEFEQRYIALSSGEKLYQFCKLQLVVKPLETDILVPDSGVDGDENENKSGNSGDTEPETGANVDIDDACVSETAYMCPQCALANRETITETVAGLVTHMELAHAEVVKMLIVKLDSHWLLDLLRTCGSLGVCLYYCMSVKYCLFFIRYIRLIVRFDAGGKCSALLVRATPITESERRYDPWLSSRLFRNGLELSLVLQAAQKKGTHFVTVIVYIFGMMVVFIMVVLSSWRRSC